MKLEARAQLYAALGDASRLQIVEMLARGDLSVQELAARAGMPGNLLAHHLNVLEQAGVIERRVSEGDHRRRYVILRPEVVPAMVPSQRRPPGSLLFVCSHNSARSLYAAARWRTLTGSPAESAGSEPAAAVHRHAVLVAAERSINLGKARPRGYESVTTIPDLVVSVCDRAWEGQPPRGSTNIHWSIADPVAAGTLAAFRKAFTELDHRIERLAGET